jgi:hypothetical protein
MDAGNLCLFLIVGTFDKISLFVAERNCRFTFGNVPTLTSAKPVTFVATTL